MRSLIALIFLIACLAEGLLGFLFILPLLPWFGFVSIALNIIGVYLAWTVIASRKKLK